MNKIIWTILSWFTLSGMVVDARVFFLLNEIRYLKVIAKTELVNC